MSTPSAPLLEISGLEIRFPGGDRPFEVVRGASLTVDRGEIVGLVGESGSGKSLTALAILGLVPPPGRVVGGRILLDGRDLRGLSERELRSVRGARIGLVFQEPMAALNPVLTLETQICEAVRAHRRRGAPASGSAPALPAPAPSSSSSCWRSPIRCAGSASIRISSPAASASAPCWRSRSPPDPSC